MSAMRLPLRRVTRIMFPAGYAAACLAILFSCGASHSTPIRQTESLVDYVSAENLLEYAPTQLSASAGELPPGELPAMAAAEIRRAADEPPAEPPYLAAGATQRGVGVRLFRGGTERGCLIYFAGVDDVEEAVRSAALIAAYHDPRYPAIEASEWPELTVEVTLLGAFEEAADPLDFTPGVHSVLLEHEEGRALLQESVALFRGWDREGVLNALAAKAGLPEGAWSRSRVRIFRAPSVSVTADFLIEPVDQE